MSGLKNSSVEVTFDDGQAITSFASFSLTERFSDPLGSLSVTTTPAYGPLAREYYERTSKGRLVGVKVDGKPQAAMMVVTQRTKIGADGGLTIDLDCSTPLKQLWESTADLRLSKKLAADVPILDLVSEVVAPFGIGEVYAEDDIAVIRSKTGKGTKAKATKVAALKASEAQVQPNETNFQFIARIITRLGVMLRMDAANGAIYITAPHYDQAPLYTVKQAPPGAGPAGDLFFGEVEIVDSNEQQFSFCEVTGSAPDKDGDTRAATPKARVESKDIHPDRPPYRSAEALAYKPVFMRDANCRDSLRARNAGMMLLGLRADSAFFVRGSVHGLVSREGIPWTVDTIGRVYVDGVGLNEEMWLSERTMRVDAQGGQATDLVWIPKGYFRLGEVAP